MLMVDSSVKGSGQCVESFRHPNHVRFINGFSSQESKEPIEHLPSMKVFEASVAGMVSDVLAMWDRYNVVIISHRAGDQSMVFWTFACSVGGL